MRTVNAVRKVIDDINNPYTALGKVPVGVYGLLWTLLWTGLTLLVLAFFGKEWAVACLLIGAVIPWLLFFLEAVRGSRN